MVIPSDVPPAISAAAGAVLTHESVQNPDWRIVAINALLAFSSAGLAAYMRSTRKPSRVTRRKKPTNQTPTP